MSAMASTSGDSAFAVPAVPGAAVSASTSAPSPPATTSLPPSLESVLRCVDPIRLPGLDLLRLKVEANGTKNKKPSWSLGRCPTADFCVESLDVSRRHATVRYDAPSRRWTCSDHRSTNGTFVDGKKIVPNLEFPLPDRCRISLGPPWDKKNQFVWDFEAARKEEEAKKSPPAEVVLGCDKAGLEALKEKDVALNIVHVYRTTEGGERRAVPVKIQGRVKWVDCDEDEEREEGGEGESGSGRRRTRGSPTEKEEEEPSEKRRRTEEEQEFQSCSQAPASSSPVGKGKKSPKKDDKAVINKLKEKFNEELSCTICNEVFISPMSMPCGHVFCQYCLSKWKKQCKSSQYDCPNCRQKVGRLPVTPNLYLENLISSWTAELGPEMLAERKKAVEERQNEMKEDEEEEARKKEESDGSRGRRSGRGRGRGRGGGRGGIEVYLITPERTGAGGQQAATGAAAVSTDHRYGLRSSPSRRRNDGDEDYSAGGPTAPTNGATAANPVIDVSSGSSSNDDDDLDLDDGGSGSGSDSDVSVDGVPGSYYGGYGRCYNCGHRGHWAPGCPYDT